MSQFIETLRVEADDSIPLLSYHIARMSRTLASENQKDSSSITEDLKTQLVQLLAESKSNCVRKYRVIYSTTGIKEATLNPYVIRPISTLALANISFDYNYKFADRMEINSCYHDHPETDDILMLKDGNLTDTSYGNIALLFGNNWYTPDSPLLNGCRRQYLMENDQIKSKKIRIEDVNSYSYLMVFNAMIPFGRILIPTRHLHF